jgi:hypothetical protein
MSRLRAALLGADGSDRLALLGEVLAGEIVILLAEEPGEARLRPQVFETSDGALALGFLDEGDLGDFVGAPAPYAALPGRVLVAMLADQGLGLALDPGGPAPQVLGAGELRWMVTAMAAPVVRPGQGRALAFAAPDLAPGHPLVPALTRRLDGVPGLGRAVLAQVTWETGARGLALVIAGLPEAAQAPLARAVAEGLAFSGAEAVAVDVIFSEHEVPGLRLEPAPFVAPQGQTPGANPGMDPARTPKLR